MKKSTKLLLLNGACLLVLGGVLCLIALFRTGGDFEELTAPPRRGGIEETLEYEADQIDRLVLDVQADDVRILPSDDGRVHLRYYDYHMADEGLFRTQAYSLSYDAVLRNGVLTVTQGYEGRRWFNLPSFGRGEDERAMTIYLPDGFAGDLEISVSLGDVELKRPLRLEGAMDCQLNCGSFEAGGLTARSVTVTCDLGNIEGDGWTIGPYLYLHTDSGSVELERTEVDGDLIGETNLGDLKLEDVSAGLVQLSNNAGDIELDRLAAEKIDLHTDLGDIEGTILGAAADYTITASTDLGNCNLSPHTAKGENTLTAHTDAGDIDLYFR